MSKFGILVLGVILGVILGAVSAVFILKRGRENMEAVLLERTETVDEQIMEAIQKRNPKFVELKTDSDGNVIVDKNKHPNIYDWIVNG